jgi:hypothetical protein
MLIECHASEVFEYFHLESRVCSYVLRSLPWVELSCVRVEKYYTPFIL